MRVMPPTALVNGSARSPLAIGRASAGRLGTSTTRGIGGAGPSGTTPWWTGDRRCESPFAGGGQPVGPVHPCRVMRVGRPTRSLGGGIRGRSESGCITALASCTSCCSSPSGC
jgi:hypothetical protein